MLGPRTVKFLGWILAAAALSGCAEQRLPLTSIAEIEHSGGQTGGDVYALLRSKGNDVPQQRGSQIVEVRTFITQTKIDDDAAEANWSGEDESAGPTELTNEVEITGADCVLKGDLFSAKVVTPAGVRVPLYGHRTAELSLQCAKEGFESGAAVVKTYNKTFEQRRQSGAGGGLIGVLIIEIINAASDETNDEYEYQFTPVILKDNAGQAS